VSLVNKILLQHLFSYVVCQDLSESVVAPRKT